MNKIDSGSYGICVFTLNVFNSYLKVNKIRTKKLIDFFNSNQDMAKDSLLRGVILPINTLSFNQYYFDFFPTGEGTFFNSNEWIEVGILQTLNLVVESDDFWIASLEILNNWSVNKFNKNIVGYPIKDGKSEEEIFYYEAQRVNFPSGKYLVKIHGYKRIKNDQYINVDEDYGYGFELTLVNDFPSYLLPSNIVLEIVK